MTHTTQSNRASSASKGLARLWADIAASLRATAEASVRIAYDKPWLRDGRRQA